MSKKVSVKTSSGTKHYKISESGGSFHCSVSDGGTIFEDWSNVGKAKNVDDALTLIKSHATKYGSVSNVSID